MTNKCECQETGVLKPALSFLYNKKLERPFVNHEPGKCKCTNNIKQYLCKDGIKRFLCSCCFTSGDKINDN